MADCFDIEEIERKWLYSWVIDAATISERGADMEEEEETKEENDK